MQQLECILLVDDAEETNYLHKYVIEECNAAKKVRIAVNGLEALDYLQNKGKFENNKENPRPQAIFLDINMPKMNGFEFLDEYAKLPESLKANICIMMLTTSLNPGDRKKAEAYDDVTDFLYKPLDEERLLELLSKHF